MRYLCLALFAVLSWAVPAAAQERITVEVWVFHIERDKILPAGHHHFIPIPADIRAKRMLSGDHVLCGTFESAISLGKRLWENKSPYEAADEIRAAHGGHAPCGTLRHQVYLEPLEVAIRSHDGVHRVHVLKLRDERGAIHFTASPIRGR